MRIAARNRRLGQDPIPPHARFWARAFVIVPILVFLIFFAWPKVRDLVGNVNNDLGAIVSSVLHQTLHHEFKIGAIHNAPGIVRIDGVSVSSKPTWKQSGGQPGLTIRRVIIRYNFPGLLHDITNATHYVESITVDHPVALIERYSLKRFNFTDLISTKPRKHAKPFVARIVVVDGTLYFRDFTAPQDSPAVPATNIAYGVNGVVDCNSDELITFTASGSGRQRFSLASVKGQISRKKPLQYSIDGSVRNGDAAYWTRYLRLVPQARVLGGRGDVDFALLVPPAPRPTVASTRSGAPIPLGSLTIMGSGTVRNGSVLWLDRRYLVKPVENMSGRFGFTNTEVNVAGSASIAGQPIRILGTVGIPPPVVPPLSTPPSVPTAPPVPPVLALTLDAPSVDLAQLSTAFPHLTIPSGIAIARATAHIDVQGPATDPVATGSVSTPSIAYAGNRITGVQAKIEYAHRILGVSSAEFGVNGSGRANVTAAVDLTPPKLTYTATGHVAGIDLAGLHLPASASRPSTAGLRYAGLLNGDFIARDSGGGSKIASNIDVTNGRLARTAIKSLRGRVVWTERRSVELDKVAVEAAGGRALVSGTVSLNTPKPRLALSVNAAGIGIKRAIDPYTSTPAGGIAYFNGLIAGPVDDPTATGTVDLFRAHYSRYDSDIVRGDITANRNMLRLYDLHIHRYPAEADLAGTITGLSTGNPRIALTATVQGAQLDDIAELMGENGRQRAAQLLPKGTSPAKIASAFNGLQGELDGKFSIGGRLHEPTLTGHVALKDITVDGDHIDTAQADVAATDQQVRIRRIVLRSNTATATGDLAWWPHSGKIQAVAAGSNVELYRFRTYYAPYADLRGSIDFSGSLSGTIKSPTVTFGVVASDVTVDGQRLAQFTGFGHYADGVLASDSGPWEFTLLVPAATSANPNATEPVTYSVDTFEMHIPQAGKPGRSVPYLSMTGHIPAEAPEHLTHIFDTLRNSKFASMPAVRKVISEYDSLPRPTDATISVPKMTVEGPVDALKFDGSIAVRNAVSGASHVAAIDADVTYTGGTSPTVGGTATAKDLLVDGIPVTSLSIANASYADRVISLGDLHAIYNGGFVDVTGRADLDGDVQAGLDASNIPLSMFNALLPKSRSLSGKIGTLTAQATGPMRAPNVMGSISVLDPAFGYRAPVAKGSKVVAAQVGPAYQLDEIRSGTISVTSPRPGGSQILTVDDLTAYRNNKPVATLNGTMPFKWNNVPATLAQLPTDQPLHARLVVDDLSILALAGPFIDPARTSGVLTATIDANDPSLSTPFAGAVTVSNASLGFSTPPSATVPGASMQASTIDTYLKNVNASITFNQSHAVVQSFTGDSSDKGSFALTGEVAFRGPQNLNLGLALKAFQVNEHTSQSLLNRLYASAAQGTVDGAITITGPFDAPVLGNSDGPPITLTEATVGLPSPQSTGGGAAPTYPVDPRFDLHFVLGSSRKPVNVKKAPMINAEVYGTADLTGRLSDPHFYSPLTINRGTVLLFGPVLRISPGGTVALRYPVTNPDTSPGQPREIMSEDVDLTATTTVSASLAQVSQYASSYNSGMGGGAPGTSLASTSDTQRTDYHITISMDGPLPTPDTRYQSDPYLDREQILALLGQQSALMGILRGGAGSGDLVASELTSVLNSVGVGMLLNPVESNIAAALGLSSFVIDYSPNAPVAVTLVAPLGHKFEASFQRSFGARAPSVVNNIVTNPQYVVKLSYKITNLLRLSISTDDQQNNTIALEGVIFFDRLPKVEKKKKSAPTPPVAVGPPPPAPSTNPSAPASTPSTKP